MTGFLEWFFAFFSQMLGGIGKIFTGIFTGLVQTFNVVEYFKLLVSYSKSSDFGILDWVLTIVSLIIVIAIWLLIFALIVLAVRKYLRFRKTIVGNEDLLEEIARLHRQVMLLAKEKERILALKIGQTSISVDAINEIFAENENSNNENSNDAENNESTTGEKSDASTAPQSDAKRFFRLAAVDDKYEFYVEPEYRTDYSMSDLCDMFRNFACSNMHLYYEIKTIRLIFAGMASTKMILLQGISGTGKTSLPYSMGKFFINDATIASVQPSWRDRTELFGYFNEFTKKFNETEVLRRIYESSYNDDINLIVLDEMNIARVEYYFAEMLSVLEMPDPREWKLDIVPNSWPNDPKHFVDGKLLIPQNVWYVGTANNDDSTFSVSDKVYDRALTINLDSKGMAFEPTQVPPERISYTYLEKLYSKAWEEFPVSQEGLDNIGKLDLYVIQKFRIAFGNRIMKQLKLFVPVYVAAGGTEVEGIDYILVTKVFRKFESLNIAVIRDEVKGLISFLDKLFGNGKMVASIAYLERLQKMY